MNDEKVIPLAPQRTVAARSATARKCPMCGRPARAETRPFCSRRCAELDLGRWLRGGYRVPTDEPVTDAAADDDDD